MAGITVTLALLAMNHEKYILQACESIAAQTYTDFEVVFLDNNSTDRTFEIADAFFKDSGIRYRGYKNDVNRNVSQNLNILVGKAETDYVTFLSGDDWYTPDNMEKKIAFLVESRADVVFTDGYRYLQDTGETIPLYDKRNKKRVLELHNYFNEAITGNYLYAIGFITKKEILLENRFDENIMMEDWDICLRLAHRGYTLAFLDHPLFYYRVMSTSLSNNLEVMAKDYAVVINKFIDHINSDRKIHRKYWLKYYKSAYRAIEKKGFGSKQHKREYAANKRDYARLKYAFPLGAVIALYWSLKIKTLKDD